MKIAFVINECMSEMIDYSTTHLAVTALMRGHDVWYINVADFSYDPDEMVHAWSYRPSRNNYRSARRFLTDLKAGKFIRERITVDTLDVLFLRNNPADEIGTRPWARLAGINFGRLAMAHDVIVLNDPDGLNHAINKKYLQFFPSDVRPRTLISHNADDIKSFAKEQGGSIVIKPLSGSGGRNVFLVRPEDRPNLNQMIETVMRDGYVVAQEYMPAAVKGDTRLFLMNGCLIERKGHVAAIHRHNSEGDMRSNITTGGHVTLPEITPAMRYIAESVGPQLIRDGMFLVGLDIVGDKILEINVFSPGGLVGASRQAKVNFMPVVIKALEKKVKTRQAHPGKYTNLELATL